jgi:hypothetical protein
MPFPLPFDIDFRKDLTRDWILDVQDRLDTGDIDGAEKSWQIAREIYLSLPPGNYDEQIEKDLVGYRGKIVLYHFQTSENENHLRRQRLGETDI